MKFILYIVFVLAGDSAPAISQTEFRSEADCIAASRAISADSFDRLRAGRWHSPEIKVMVCLRAS